MLQSGPWTHKLKRIRLLSVPWEAWAVREKNWIALPKTSNARVRPAGRYRPPLFSFERTPPILEWFVSPKNCFRFHAKIVRNREYRAIIKMQRIVKKNTNPFFDNFNNLFYIFWILFIVFSKLIMIRNRTEITILILDLYLYPCLWFKTWPFLLYRGRNFSDKKQKKNFSLASSSVLLSSILLTHSWSISFTAPSIFCWADPKLAGKSANERWKEAICWWPENTHQMKVKWR